MSRQLRRVRLNSVRRLERVLAVTSGLCKEVRSNGFATLERSDEFVSNVFDREADRVSRTFMRIQDLNLAGAGAAASQGAQKVEREAALQQNSAVARDGDHVALSGLTGSLGRTLAADSAQRAQRVESLAALYQAGNYKVDAGKVGGAMIQEAVSSHGG